MRPIVLATDGSDAAQAATREAIGLASALEAPLVIVTAWQFLVTQFSGYGLMAVPDLDAVEEGLAHKVNDTAADDARAAGLAVETVIERGLPVEEICRAARERDARLVVLGTHGWGPVRRMVFGSVSTGVLHHAPCPVLAVPATAEKERSGDATRDHESVPT